MYLWRLFNGPLLWGFLWQTTLCLVLGLFFSVLARRNPGRAHFILLLTLLAAAALPAISLAQRCEAPLWASPVSPGGARAGQIWFGVSVLMLAQLAAGLLLGLRSQRRARPLVSERLRRMLHAAMEKLELREAPAAYTTTDVNCPAVLCWGFRPVLLLPEPMAMRPGEWSDAQWIAIFCHELARLRRLDHIAALLTEVICRMLWWQPLAWICRARLHRLRDQACDILAVRRGQTADEYGELLRSMTPQTRSLAALAMVSDKQSLEQRIAICGQNAD